MKNSPFGHCLCVPACNISAEQAQSDLTHSACQSQSALPERRRRGSICRHNPGQGGKSSGGSRAKREDG